MIQNKWNIHSNPTQSALSTLKNIYMHDVCMHAYMYVWSMVRPEMLPEG